MVPYTLPFSAVFISKIVAYGVAVIVITNVGLSHQQGSVTVGASNGTVILVTTTGPGGPPGGNATTTAGTDGQTIGTGQNDTNNTTANVTTNLSTNSRSTVQSTSPQSISSSISSLIPQNTLETNVPPHVSSNPPSNVTPSPFITAQPTVKSALDQFPPDFIPENIRNNGGVIIHILILAYCCLALGVVCDVFFLPALQFISDSLHLPSHIAGATFMAIGTSAPELFTSVIGVFISEDDIGTGTILGTAVFNLIFIPAACGFAVMAFCPNTPNISKFPILRDSIFYILTIATLILVMKDNSVDWVESLILVGMFGVYLVIMYFNAQYAAVIENIDDREPNEHTPLLRKNSSAIVSIDNEHNEVIKIRTSSLRKIGVVDVKSESKMDVIDDEEDNWVERSCFFKYLLLPMTLLFKITLPKPTKFCFVITFMMSVVWIGTLTYVCVWMVTIIGYTFGIPETVAGLSILAAGTSVPELISSVIVVKKAGLADMAICNSIGSNIFDILFCLGMPWLLKSIMIMFQTGSVALVDSAIPIQSDALPLTALTLLITIFALLITFHLTNWKLGLTVGVTCTIVYVLFVAIASVLEIQMAA